MLQLTEIAANFADVLEEGVINDTELLTSLIQDLNVRGATAFVHLVQASDEFTGAVDDLANAGGELDEMVRIQNESLQAQIQILKNNVMAIFFLRDATYEGTEFMNAFHEALINAVAGMQEILVELDNGKYVLTEFGQELQNIGVTGIKEATKVMQDFIKIIKEFSKEGFVNVEMLKVMLIPLQVLVRFIQFIGPEATKLIVTMMLLNKVFSLTAIYSAAAAIGQIAFNSAVAKGTMETKHKIVWSAVEIAQMQVWEALTWKKIWAMITLQSLRVSMNKTLRTSIFLDAGEAMWKKILYILDVKQMAIDGLKLINAKLGIKMSGLRVGWYWKTIAAKQALAIQEKISLAYDALDYWWQNKRIKMKKQEWMYDVQAETTLKATNLQTAYRIVLEKIRNRQEAVKLFFQQKINMSLFSQIALTALGAIGWSLFWIAATGGIIILITFFVVLAVKLNEQFDLLKQFKIFFQHIIGMVAWYVQVWIDAGVALADWAMNGTSVIMKFGLFVKHIFLMIAYYIDGATDSVVWLVGGLKDAVGLIGDVVDFARTGGNWHGYGNIPFIPFAAAGKANVYGRQYGGSTYSEGGGSYMVGEKGPEMFVPRTSGQIIPNKDLNSARTNRLYDQSMGSTQVGSHQTSVMYVDRIESKNTNSKNTKIGVDVFA